MNTKNTIKTVDLSTFFGNQNKYRITKSIKHLRVTYRKKCTDTTECNIINKKMNKYVNMKLKEGKIQTW